MKTMKKGLHGFTIKLDHSHQACFLPCPDLSLYELHRKPHDMVSDNSAIAVSPRSLHSELMCPICLDLMRSTQTTKEVSSILFS